MPASPWLDSVPPATPLVRVGRDAASGATTVSLQPQGPEAPWLWVIRARLGSDWNIDVVPGLQRFYTIPKTASGVATDELAVSAVDRTGNESAPALVGLTATSQ